MRHIQNGLEPQHGGVLRQSLHPRIQQQIGDHHRPGGMGRIIGDGHETGVADGAAVGHKGPHQRGQFARHNRRRRPPGVKGHADIDLAIRQQLTEFRL